MDEKLKAKYLKDIEYFSKKLEEDPKSKVFMPLAMAYLKLEKYDEAIEVASTGLDLNPEYLVAKTVLAQGFLGKGMLNEAKGLLVEVAAFSESNYRAQKYLGEIYRIEGNMEKAIYYYRSASLSAPEDYELRGLIDELANMVDATPKTIEEIEASEEQIQQEQSPELQAEEKQPETLEDMAKTLAEDVMERGVDEPENELVVDVDDNIEDVSELLTDEPADLPKDDLSDAENVKVDIDDILKDEFSVDVPGDASGAVDEVEIEDTADMAFSEELEAQDEKDLAGELDEIFSVSDETVEKIDEDFENPQDEIFSEDFVSSEALPESSDTPLTQEQRAIENLEKWLGNISKSKESRHV